jgi:hypothetical protein
MRRRFEIAWLFTVLFRGGTSWIYIHIPCMKVRVEQNRETVGGVDTSYNIRHK